MSKRWSKTETAHLRRHAGAKKLEELAQELDTDTEAVRTKLIELGLQAEIQPGIRADPALHRFKEAWGHLHEHKWQKAAKIFEEVIATADTSQLKERARQYLDLCQQKTQPSEDQDPYLRAVFEKNRGNLDEALKLCQEHGKVDEDERYAYLLASIRALTGDADQALEHLATAIRLEPKNRVHAYHDPDFQALQGQQKLSNLLA